LGWDNKQALGRLAGSTLLFGVLLIGCLILGATPASSLELSSNFPTVELGDQVQVFEDETGELGWADVKKLGPGSWESGDEAGHNFGYTQSTLWFRVTVHCACEHTEEMVLELSSRGLDLAELWQESERQTVHQRVGDHISREEWPLDTDQPAFSLQILPNTSTQLYIKAQSTDALWVPLTLFSQKNYGPQRQLRVIFQSIVLGILGVMFFYNLFLWFVLKDRSYLYYVSSIFAFIGFSLSNNGFGYQYFWSDSNLFVDSASPLFALLVALGALLFVREFLDLKLNQPRLNRTFFWCGWGGVAASPGLYLLPGYLRTPTLHLFLVLLIFLMSFSSIKALFQSVPQAKYCIAAWGFHGAGAVWFGMKPLVGLPDIMLFDQMITWGAVANLLLLSFGLANRIHQLRQDRISAQLAMLKSNRMAMEAVKASDRLQDEFLANTSQALLTPVHQFISLIQLGNEKISHGGDPSSELRSGLQIAQRLRFMVQDILDYSQWKRGGIRLRTQNVGLHQTVESVLATFERIAAVKGVALVNRVSAELPPVTADWNKLNQCLFKLVDNGLNYTDNGRLAVYGSVTAKGVELEVRDTGVGMEPELVERVLNPFQRGGDNKQLGIGLGLSLVNRLVELQGGRFWIKSVVNEGTSAFLELNAANQDDPVVQIEALYGGPALVEPSGAGGSEQLKILVIEPDPIDQDLLTHILRSKGYQPIGASNGAQALKQLGEEPNISLILLDGLLPMFDGETIAKKIRTTQVGAVIPILQMSSYYQTTAVDWQLSPDVDDVIYKPIHGSELIARVVAQLRAQKGVLVVDDQQPLKANPKKLLRLIAKIMNLSLSLWERYTKKDKLALAEESGLWTVSPESSGSFRTRTLDRYLKVSLLPKNPRYRTVLQTGYFVRDFLVEGSEDFDGLNKLLFEMESYSLRE